MNCIFMKIRTLLISMVSRTGEPAGHSQYRFEPAVWDHGWSRTGWTGKAQQVQTGEKPANRSTEKPAKTVQTGEKPADTTSTTETTKTEYIYHPYHFEGRSLLQDIRINTVSEMFWPNQFIRLHLWCTRIFDLDEKAKYSKYSKKRHIRTSGGPGDPKYSNKWGLSTLAWNKPNRIIFESLGSVIQYLFDSCLRDDTSAWAQASKTKRNCWRN